MTRQEIESVGFEYDDCRTLSKKYDPAKLHEGFNTVEGEEVLFVSNPGLGLWAHKDRFDGTKIPHVGKSEPSSKIEVGHI
jgi:hypothetical protein